MLLVFIGFPAYSLGEERERLHWEPTDAELRLLPPYCTVRYTAEKYSPEAKKLTATIGEAWAHFHHYCAGLNALVRADKSIDRDKQRAHLNDAIGQFTYVERHTRDKKSIVFPELFFLKGQANERLGNDPVAAALYVQALQAKPDYAQAYAKLAGLYLKQKRNAEARTILEEGLKRSPNSESLKRLMSRVGG